MCIIKYYIYFCLQNKFEVRFDEAEKLKDLNNCTDDNFIPLNNYTFRSKN